MSVVLISGSPRRSEILHRAGIHHRIYIPEIAENITGDQTLDALVQRLAVEKLEAGLSECKPGEYGLAADTMVDLTGNWLGKPVDFVDGFRMLSLLSGNTHIVRTGVAIQRVADGKRVEFTSSTAVTFYPLTKQEIEEYLASGEPLDKAGAYGVQTMGSRYIERIDGCFFNVMGLPISRVYEGLRSLGWSN